MTLQLKATTPTHLHTLFEFQRETEANYLAAFTSNDPNDKNAYLKKWSNLLLNNSINCKTIIVNNAIVGSITKFEMDQKAEITYWIGKQYWGQGIASKALKQFLEMESTRPLYGRVAFDNYGSQKVLVKCDFEKIGTETGYANARGAEIEEHVYKLD